MHNLYDEHPTWPSFEPSTSEFRAITRPNEPSGPANIILSAACISWGMCFNKKTQIIGTRSYSLYTLAGTPERPCRAPVGFSEKLGQVSSDSRPAGLRQSSLSVILNLTMTTVPGARQGFRSWPCSLLERGPQVWKYTPLPDPGRFWAPQNLPRAGSWTIHPGRLRRQG